VALLFAAIGLYLTPLLARAYFCCFARSNDIDIFFCRIARMRATSQKLLEGPKMSLMMHSFVPLMLSDNEHPMKNQHGQRGRRAAAAVVAAAWCQRQQQRGDGGGMATTWRRLGGSMAGKEAAAQQRRQLGGGGGGGGGSSSAAMGSGANPN
jgi:hypothetical protein